MAKIIDLSHKISENIQIYPGDPKPEIKEFATIDQDGYSVHQLHLGTHTGTHIDAPSHFIKNGRTIDQIELDRFIGVGVIVDCSDKVAREAISLEDLKHRVGSIHPGDIVMLYTGWDQKIGSTEYENHPYLLPEAAEWLVDCGVSVVGIDALNIDPTWGDIFPVHEILLGSEVLIVENLTNLRGILNTKPMIMVLPLHLADCDGSPVRAVALDQEFTDH